MLAELGSEHTTPGFITPIDTDSANRVMWCLLHLRTLDTLVIWAYKPSSQTQHDPSDLKKEVNIRI